jgi:hypothetical protein
MEKQFLLSLITCILFISCTKNEDDIKDEPPKSYEEIKWKHINARELELTETIIPVSGLNGLKLQPGTVIIFKTFDNRLGKIKVNSIDPAQNYLMNISARVYTNTYDYLPPDVDKPVKAETNSLNIRGNFGCNLDTLLEVNGNSTQDFWIQRVNSTDTEFRPVNGAKYAKYIF